MKKTCKLLTVMTVSATFGASALLSELSKVDDPKEPLDNRIGLACTLLSEYPNGVSVGTSLPVRAAIFMFTLDPATLQEVPAYEYFVADAERILFDFLLNANLDTTSNEECSLLQKAAYCVARRNNTPDDILQRIKDIHSRFGSFSPQE